jgi:putative transposase
MGLNGAGQMEHGVWAGLPAHYLDLEIDAFVVMPNHAHGIVALWGSESKSRLAGAGLKHAPTNCHGLPEIVRGFKTFSARGINEQQKTCGPVWQRGYCEHIIRHGESLDRIRKCIFENPARWESDPANPRAIGPESEDAWAGS